MLYDDGEQAREEEVAAQPYIAVAGDFSHLLAQGFSSTPTEDGHTVFGATVEKDDPIQVFPSTHGDVTVLPVIYEAGLCWCVEGDSVIGHSVDVAVWLVHRLRPTITMPLLFTGQIIRDVVVPVLGVEIKAELAKAADMQLVGGTGDFPGTETISDLAVLLTFAESAMIRTRDALIRYTTEDDRMWAMARCLSDFCAHHCLLNPTIDQDLSNFPPLYECFDLDNSWYATVASRWDWQSAVPVA
jgi:hypothetical protein